MCSCKKNDNKFKQKIWLGDPSGLCPESPSSPENGSIFCLFKCLKRHNVHVFVTSWGCANTNCPLSEEEHLLARRSDFDMGLLVSFNHDHDISQSYRSMNLNAYQTLKCCAAMHQIMRQLSTTVACMYLFVLQDDDALRCGNG